MKKKNPYAFLIEGPELKEATDKVEAIVVEMVNEIKSQPHTVEKEVIGWAFYGNLHWGTLGEERMTGDTRIDDCIKKAIEKIREVNKEYPEAGIGDTMTDECIAYHVDELMKATPVMHNVLLNRG